MNVLRGSSNTSAGSDRVERVIEPAAGIDPLLEPLVQGTHEDGGLGLMTHLVSTHADPVVRSVIHFKLRLPSQGGARQADAEDLYQDAIVQLLESLEQFRKQPDAHPIHDIRGLAAVIAHRTCSNWMRRRFPARHAFKNRLRYSLSRQNGLALWPVETKKLMAGFASWQGKVRTTSGKSLTQVMDEENVSAQIRQLTTGGSQSHVAVALAAIFDGLGGPVEFEELVSAMASALSIRDQPADSIGSNGFDLETACASGVDTAWRVEKRIFLQRVWDEVRRLPFHQRAALLLNLQDVGGGGCLAVFQISGIATFRELAETLEMSAEAFAELWNELPIPDIRIAGLLQLTRQQVINARKSARERLRRRLRGFL